MGRIPVHFARSGPVQQPGPRPPEVDYVADQEYGSYSRRMWVVEEPGMKKGKPMIEALYLVGFMVFWIALNRWILPRLGVPT